jgi:general secretion pathway protein E
MNSATTHPSDETAKAALLGWSIVHLQDLIPWTPDFKQLPFAEAARRRCALFHADHPPNPQPRFIATDPHNADQLAWARTRFGNIEAHLASPSTFDAWLGHAEKSMTALDNLGSAGALAGEVNTSTPNGHNTIEHLSLRGIDARQSPAVRFVNSTLYDALKTGASDIHLESNPSGLVVKFRIDGVLTPMRRLEGGTADVALAEQSISRIKVMAQLDIAERRIPQDGRLQIQYGELAGTSANAATANTSRTIDVRVSIMPSIHGEDAVLRILDRQHLAQTLAGLTLEKLGYDTTAQQALKALCRKPHGMLLVTGPTGSGKTTTLYAAITETHESRDKVITIEDPVEYQLPGVLQIPVNERKGLTFAKGLRSILRHDPDKILVGEIRDSETAQIAVQSALTGHLVFTTVHANTVFDVVGRFEQFGIDAYTFSSAINGVLAQRLLRKLCPHCAQPLPASEAAALHAQLQGDADYQQAWAQACSDSGADKQTGEATTPPQFHQAKGCSHCRGTGYTGRFALGELLTLTPQAKTLIARKAPQAEIQQEAQRSGWRSLRQQALLAAMQGRTSLEEVERVAA